MDLMPTLANASLISTRSRSAGPMPSFSQALRIAAAGWDCRVESGPATTPCAPISASQRQPELLGLGLAHHDDGRRTVGDLRGRAGGDRAVLAERRAQLAQALGRGVGADALVVPEHERVALALRDLDRHDLVVEQAVLPGRGRPLVRAAPRTRPAPRGRCRARRCTPRSSAPIAWVGEDVPQAVVGHRVDQLHVAELHALAGLRQEVRGLGHRLHAAGDDDVELAGPDQLVGQRDRVDAGQAHLVDGQRRHGHRDAALDGRLAGRDLAGAGLQHLAHDHVLDLVRAPPRPSPAHP